MLVIAPQGHFVGPMGLGRKPICVFHHAHKVNYPDGAREGGLGRDAIDIMTDSLEEEE